MIAKKCRTVNIFVLMMGYWSFTVALWHFYRSFTKVVLGAFPTRCKNSSSLINNIEKHNGRLKVHSSIHYKILTSVLYTIRYSFRHLQLVKWFNKSRPDTDIHSESLQSTPRFHVFRLCDFWSKEVSVFITSNIRDFSLTGFELIALKLTFSRGKSRGNLCWWILDGYM